MNAEGKQTHTIEEDKKKRKSLGKRLPGKNENLVTVPSHICIIRVRLARNE